MYANGTIVSTTSVTSAAFLYNSDRRLKQNIVPLSNSLSKILSLNGYSFDWRKDGRHDIGVIAQEVEKVFPALVSSNSETGMKSVEYGNLVAPIIEAIKELVHKLDTFENSLNKQQSEIDILKTENARIKTENARIKTENTLLKNRLDAIEVRLAK
jgi:uncharacterized protein YicC (UPF0701 family)